MERIKRFVECVIPVTACNLKCDYCYVIQRNNNKQRLPEMKYSAERIGKAFQKERWGGICYVSICGQGETLAATETLDIAYEILKQGHFVNVTTNGTLSRQFERLEAFPKDFLERFHFAFSFHYLELLRLNLLDQFFDNVNKVRKLGCSYVLQMNLYDDYIPGIDAIKKITYEKVGAYPQLAATRKEVDLKSNIQLFTKGSVEDYKAQGKRFDSPLFDFTMKNFNVKQTHFCYAGEWSFQLNLADGILSRCYSSNITHNIFEDPASPIAFAAMGHACSEPFCINASHFMALGVIPDVETPSYAELRDRAEAGWYSDRMRQFLNSRLYETNRAYSFGKRLKSYACHAGEIRIKTIIGLKRRVKLLLKISLEN